MSAPVRLDASDVFNQSPPYEDVDLYGRDQPLRDALAADSPGTREATSLLIDTLKRAETAATARGAVERLALLAAAAALNEWAPRTAEPFERVRLSEPHGSTYGSAGLTAAETRRLLER